MKAFSHHESCPKCGSRDNLGVWEDGHKYCFGCKFYVPSNIYVREHKEMIKTNGYYDPPRDASEIIDEEGLKWLMKYKISPELALKYEIKWSKEKHQLVFILRTSSSEGVTAVGGWQARNFLPSKPKYFTKLKEHLKETLVVSVSSNWKSNSVVIVEDLISAIRIAECCSESIALLGCILHKQHYDHLLRKQPEQIFVWLDDNKYNEAMKQVTKLNLMGLNAVAIRTEKDPKEYSDEEIRNVLGNGRVDH